MSPFGAPRPRLGVAPMNETSPASEPAASTPPADTVGSGIDFSDPKSPLAPFYLRTAGVAAFGLLALLFVFVGLLPLWHTDVWANVKFGEWMATHRALPEHEPFSPWGDKQTPFVSFAALSQLAFYGAYWAGATLAGGDAVRQLAGGVTGLRTLFSLLVLLRFTLLLLAYRRVSGSTSAATAMLAVLFFFSLPSVGVMRPQLFGGLFFALLLFTLSRPLLSWRALVGLPFLFAVWANFHDSFLIGLAVLGVFLIGRAAVAWRERGVGFFRGLLRDAQVHRLLLALAACGAAVCVNPYGPRIYPAALRLSHLLTEWQPPRLNAHPPFFGASVLFALLFVAILWAWSRRLPSPTALLLVVLFGAGACCQQRLTVWLAMAAPWAAAPHWAAVTEQWAASRKRAAGVASFRKTLLGAALFLAAWMWSPAMMWVTAGTPPPLNGSMSPGTPWQLARQLCARTTPSPSGCPS